MSATTRPTRRHLEALEARGLELERRAAELPPGDAIAAVRLAVLAEGYRSAGADLTDDEAAACAAPVAELVAQAVHRALILMGRLPAWGSNGLAGPIHSKPVAAGPRIDRGPAGTPVPTLELLVHAAELALELEERLADVTAEWARYQEELNTERRAHAALEADVAALRRLLAPPAT